MPWKQTDEGYEQDENGKHGNIPSMPGIFSIPHLIKTLYGLCWSVARIATRLKISQDEVRAMLKDKE